MYTLTLEVIVVGGNMVKSYLEANSDSNYLGKALVIISVGLSFKIATARSLNLGYGDNTLVLENQTKELKLQQQKLANVTQSLDDEKLPKSKKRELEGIKQELVETGRDLDKIDNELTEKPAIIEEIIK